MAKRGMLAYGEDDPEEKAEGETPPTGGKDATEMFQMRLFEKVFGSSYCGPSGTDNTMVDRFVAFKKLLDSMKG